MTILTVGENRNLKNETNTCKDTYCNFIFYNTKFVAININYILTVQIVVSLLISGIRHLDHLCLFCSIIHVFNDNLELKF